MSAPLAADHAVARDHDRDRRASDRGGDAAHDVGPADCLGQLGVAERRAVGDLQQTLPDALLERGAREVEIELEVAALAGEVLVELLAGAGRAPAGHALTLGQAPARPGNESPVSPRSLAVIVRGPSGLS